MTRTVKSEWEMACPKCSADHAIDICANIWVRLSADGTDPYEAEIQHHDWGDENDATCAACGHAGTVGDFRTEGRDSE